MERNNYDKLGHPAQGFIPAVIVREVPVRLEVVAKWGWLSFIIICICLALSAFYELIEWWTALLAGEAVEAFLGTPGYVWDTLSEIGLALLGNIMSLSLLTKINHR